MYILNKIYMKGWVAHVILLPKSRYILFDNYNLHHLVLSKRYHLEGQICETKIIQKVTQC